MEKMDCLAVTKHTGDIETGVTHWEGGTSKRKEKVERETKFLGAREVEYVER